MLIICQEFSQLIFIDSDFENFQMSKKKGLIN
jgi:hypothetical protein